jgi:protein O-mannosyl-transferase
MINRFKVFSILMILTAGLIVYMGVLKAPFIYDDFHLIVNNRLITSFIYIPRIFEPLFKAAGSVLPVRPLQFLSYMLDYKIWRLDPAGYHFVNILIHILNGLLVYIICIKFLKREKAAFLAALFFTVHPLNTASVSYISGRADLLAGFFSFISLILFFHFIDNKQSKRKSYIFLSLLSFAAALLSKEIALIVPLLIFAYLVLFYRSNQHYIVGYIVISVLFILIRAADIYPASFELTLKERIFTAPYLFFKYLKMAFLPYNLRLSYALNYLDSFKDFRSILYLSLFILFISLGLSLTRYKRELRLLFIWYILHFLLISGLLAPLNAPCAEHWLYLGLPALFALTVAAIYRFFYLKNTFKYAGALFIAGLLFFYAFLTLERNKDWIDPESFYKNEIKHTPLNYKAYYNLGILYFNQGRYPEAKDQFKKATLVFPELYLAYFGLALVAEKENDFEEAAKNYSISLYFKPDFSLAAEYLQSLKKNVMR